VGIAWRTTAALLEALRDASAEPGRARDHAQPEANDGGSDRPRNALAGRRETLGRDGRGHDGHRAQIEAPVEGQPQRFKC
jgi:hypothetical protein